MNSTSTTQASTKKEPFMTWLTGVAMGAADVVPGVSGGTIAFISGRYERLIDALSSFDLRLWAIWKKEGFSSVWKAIDGTFLTLIFSGVLVSIFSLANAIHYGLEHHAPLLWGYFFGLILASSWMISRRIETHSLKVLVIGLGGLALGIAVGFLSPTETPVTAVTLFFGGMIAICAMILPGISGSFILLMMGLYSGLIAAVKSLDIALLICFAVGAIIGLLSFVRLLSYLLHHYHNETLGLLTGIMLGALGKVWPWKNTLSFRLDRQGNQKPLLQENVMPWTFEQLSGEASQWMLVLLLGLLGMATVLLIEYFGRTDKAPQAS